MLYAIGTALDSLALMTQSKLELVFYATKNNHNPALLISIRDDQLGTCHAAAG